MKSLRYLDRHYYERGYNVYSRRLSHLLTVPPAWKGPLPDMLVEKGEQRIAIFQETSDTLSDSVAHTAWRGDLPRETVPTIGLGFSGWDG